MFFGVWYAVTSKWILTKLAMNEAELNKSEVMYDVDDELTWHVACS
jgi:hypothetical protein